MADQFTTTTTTGYGRRIINALIGVPVGILLIIIAIVLLWMNEGRTDLSKIAAKSTEVPSSAVTASEGSFISTTGDVSATQPIGDGLYLKPGPYVAVERVVEQFSWKETKQTDSKTNVGGSETTTTEYKYTTEWQSEPADSSQFKQSEGHVNPPKSLSNSSTRATDVTIGAYKLNAQGVDLPELVPLQLSSANTNIAAATPGVTLVEDRYLYRNPSSATSPQVGDIRISYRVLGYGGKLTVFGAYSAGIIDRYTDPKGKSIFRLLVGDRAAALKTMHDEFVTMGWVMRLVGFIMLFIGFMMIVAPINVLLDFLPIAGTISRAILGLIAFPLALAVWGTVIIVSMIAHNPIALAISIFLVLAAFIGFLKFVKKRKAPAAVPPPVIPPAA